MMADTSKNCKNVSVHLNFCDLVLSNLDRFYSIFATIQYFEVWESAIMDKFMTFRKRVYTKLLIILTSFFMFKMQ